MEKSQRRLDLTNKVAEKLINSPQKTPKKILQEKPSLAFEDQLSKDYKKEQATMKTIHLDEIRNKIKFHNEKRNEILDFWEKNNELADKSIDNSSKQLNTTQDHLFKNHKNLSHKMMNEDKMKFTERKFYNKQSESKLKVTEFCKMTRDLSKIQLQKNIMAKEQEMERKMLRSKSTIQGRNLFNIKDQ